MADKQWFADWDHAMATGMLAGALHQAGMQFNIARDTQGNYKPFIELVILEPGEVEPIRVTVQVMPGAQRAGQDERDDPDHSG